MNHITAAILAGGLGTRLRPAVGELPKVLAPIHSRPFITLLLDQLAAAGVRNVVLLTGYRADEIQRTLGNSYAGLSLSYSRETSPLGTGGAIRHALPLLKSDTILVMNGDTYCDVPWNAFLAQHQRRWADMTLALTHVPDAARFGQVLIDEDEKVTSFLEKQSQGAPGLVNAGVYFIEKLLIDEITLGEPVSLERDLLPTWIQRRAVQGFISRNPFLDIGTPAAYAAAATFLS